MSRPRCARPLLTAAAVALCLAAQLLLDAKTLVPFAVGAYLTGLVLLGAVLARPLRRAIHRVARGEAGPDPFADGTPVPAPWPRAREAAALLGVMAVAGLFRLFRLDQVPPGFNHDTALLCQYPIELLAGRAPLTPFYGPPLHYPIGYETFQPLVTAAYISLLGVVPLAAKLSAATSGMLALVVLYLCVRYLFHPRMALIATFLAAVCPWHFLFSRIGWHCIAVPLWETTAMLLLLAALRSGRTLLFPLAGAATAVNLMTYSISRLLLPKQLLVGAYLWLTGALAPRRLWPRLLLFALALLLAGAPVAHYAFHHWDVFQGRTRALLILERTVREGPAPLLDNLGRTALNLNFRAGGDDFLIDEPLLDFPLSLLFALGLVPCVLLADRPRYGVVLIWLLASLVPGLLSAPNPNHNMGALFPAMIVAAVAVELGWVWLGGRLAARPRAARAVLALAGVAALIMVVAPYRRYLQPDTRRDLWGFYPETRVVGEYMRSLLPSYDVYVANNYPVDALMFLTYAGGDYTPRFHHLWHEPWRILDPGIDPGDGRGVAFIAKPAAENEPVFQALLTRYPGAARELLRDSSDPRHPGREAATVILIGRESLLHPAPLSAVDGRVDLERFATAFSGGRGSGSGQFEEPMGVAFTPDGGFVVADLRNSRVQRFDRDGRPLLVIGRAGDHPGELNEPRDVAVDSDGNLFVVDSWNSRVQKLDPQGNYLLSLTTERGLFGPRSATVDGDRVLVVDSGNSVIEVFHRDGRHLETWCRRGRGKGELREPVGIAADGHGSVYVVDSGNARVQKLDRRGRVVTVWPIRQWAADGLLREAHVACDRAGSVLVAEPGSGVVLRFTEEGEPRGSIGEGLAATGVAVRGGDILVTERAANRVRRLRLSR